MRRTVLIGSIVVALAGAGAAGYWLFGRAPLVTVGAVQRGPAVEAVYATGTVEPVHWAKVGPTVKGRLAEVLVGEGQRVSAGQTLARLEDTKARAEIAELAAREQFLREEVRRLGQLVRDQVASRAAHDKAQSELAQVQALARAAAQRLADLSLIAPLSGVVLRRDGAVGEIVDTNQVLFWVGQLRPLWIVAEVDEEDIPRVRLGQVTLIKSDAFVDRVLQGSVSEITLKGDPLNKSYRVRVALPDDTPLLVGMTAEVNIVLRAEEAALLVPSSAVVKGAVWVVEQGRARRRPVVTGVVGDDRVEIRSGLDGDARIILAPPASLTPDAPVRVEGGLGG